MLNFKYIALIAAALLGILLICEPLLYVSFWWYILLFLAFFLVVLIGSFSMSWKFFLKAFTSNTHIKTKKIAITFDDGPNPEFTPKVLELLKEFDAKASFFCIGRHVKKYPELLKQIHTEGHDIGNHSFIHSMTIDFKSTEGWLVELKNTDQAIFNAIGIKSNLFRPPFGVTTPHLAKALKVTGHRAIGWNIRPFDMALKNRNTILKRILKQIKPGSVILLHDKHEHIEFVLEQLLQFLKKQDYEMVTINELINEA
jgi:peptidoglycan/xylan/chitin deacetylase (PgdA/CDA1 family)